MTGAIRHEIGATNEFEFIHNNNGSLTCWEKEDPADSISYGYDYNNRLTSVQQGTDETEYLLDASGARVGRVHNAVTNYFVVDQTDGLKRPLAELSIQNSSLIIHHSSFPDITSGPDRA